MFGRENDVAGDVGVGAHGVRGIVKRNAILLDFKQSCGIRSMEIVANSFLVRSTHEWVTRVPPNGPIPLDHRISL